MTDTLTAPVNPHYAARLARRAVPPPAPPPGYARLPRVPRNASPVPELTSLWHDPDPGPWGERSYPGNCSGSLIRAVLRFYAARRVWDPMSGGGTCRDVCRDLGVACVSADIHAGFDACAPDAAADLGRFAFVWAHPAYWRQKLYLDDPRDLSRAPTLDAFLERYARFLANCAAALAPGGHLGVLMGDYSDKDAGYVSLTYHTKRLAFAAGLRQCATDVIRFSHGASSGTKVYKSRFIPGLHDTLSLFTKPCDG